MSYRSPMETQAVSGGGTEGAQSAAASGKTPLPDNTVTLPGTPTGLRVEALSSAEILVSWGTVTGAASYKIYRLNSSTGAFTDIGAGSTTTYSDTGLTANTQYYYRVSAVSSGGTEGAQSEAAPGTTLPEPLTGTPTISETPGVGQTLTADITGLNGTGTITYQWKRGNTATGPFTNITTNGTGASYTLTAADEGKYIVVEVSRAGYSGSVTSVPTPAVTGTPPGPVDFTYTTNGNTVTITGYTGTATNVVIPAIIEGKSVTAIGDEAFRNRSGLTSVTIPNGVTSIGGSAFAYCSSLTSVTIPDSVTVIGLLAFSNCSSLTTVTIPNSVTSIGGSAFAYCRSLTSVTIPDSVTSIGGGAFDSCSSLTSVTIPNSVTSIGMFAFQFCSSLTSITISNSVTSIGQAVFAYCSSLTTVTIPNSVTTISSTAFYHCSGLTSITVDSGNTNYKSIDGVLFNKAGTTLVQYLEGKTGAYTIPNGVTSIGGSAFAYCSSLTSVTIPNSVISIGQQAFSDCTGLTSVTLGSGITSWGGYAEFPGDLKVKYKASGAGTYTRPSGSSNTWTKQ
ncbi:hypothetical protein FACS189445_2130 [Spirochaetia bacterium]|nr:hypothetical protein FACS189445_2130 [Spirochaetia bacterium]